MPEPPSPGPARPHQAESRRARGGRRLSEGRRGRRHRWRCRGGCPNLRKRWGWRSAPRLLGDDGSPAADVTTWGLAAEVSGAVTPRTTALLARRETHAPPGIPARKSRSRGLGARAPPGCGVTRTGADQAPPRIGPLRSCSFHRAPPVRPGGLSCASPALLVSPSCSPRSHSSSAWSSLPGAVGPRSPRPIRTPLTRSSAWTRRWRSLPVPSCSSSRSPRAASSTLEEAHPVTHVDVREVHQENGGEELASPYVSGEELDVAAWARDALALALPAQVLCRPDCAGLCPAAGRTSTSIPDTSTSPSPTRAGRSSAS